MSKTFFKYKEVLEISIIILIFFIVRKGKDRYIVDLIVMGITLFFVIYKRQINRLNKYLIFFLLAYLLSTSLSFIKGNLKNNEAFFDYIIHGYIVFLILSQMQLTEKYYKYFLPFLALCSLIITIKSIREWSLVGFDPNYRIYKSAYPTIISIELGVYVLICFISFLYSKGYIKKIIYFIILIISIIALFSANSRNTLMTIPIIILGIFLIEYRKNLKVSHIVVLIFSLFFLLKTPYVNQYFHRVKKMTNIENIKKETRIKIWNYGLEKFEKNNYKAFGFKYFEKNKIKVIQGEENPHLHNVFLEIMVTQGIPALLFYIFFNIFLLKEMLKKIRTTIVESQKVMNYLTIAILIFYNLSGLVDANIYFKKVNLLVYFLYALALCNVSKEEKI